MARPLARSAHPGRSPSNAALWLVVALVCGCSPTHEVVQGCEAARGITPVCGFQNPEDLAVLADDRHVLVSQFGGMGPEVEPGSLALFDTETGRLSVLFPPPSGTDAAAPRSDAEPSGDWGASDCPGPPPPEFAPHGIDLVQRGDGRRMLAVVNHGGRESVELFEVLGEGRSTRLAWRGCATPPEGAYLNDVVLLRDGGLLTTHMMNKSAPTIGLIRAAFGGRTGLVYEWSAADGFRAVPGTDLPFPNGIELSDDEADVYVNLYMTSELRRIDRRTGERLASVEVSNPDNLSWSRDGRLLVASHVGGLADAVQCQSIESGACPLPFEILSLDPRTLQAELLFANGGAPMGGGTVAVEVGDALLIGSFAGDRVIRVANPRR